jgi:putative ABC transport system permease protein
LRWNANLDFGNETETLKLTFGTANLFSILQVTPMLGFRFPFQSDLWWLNDRYFDRQNRGWRIDQTIGRLKPGVSREQAQAEMQEIAARLAQAYPDTNTEITASVTSLRDFWFGKLRRSFWLLFGACGFVLLIACANVANLLMTQATVRERELAVRAALGASHGRLIRQSISEAFLLVFIGAASGLLLGGLSLRLLVSLLPQELLPFFVKIELDGRALLFTLLISVVTAILVGLIPALRTG